MPVEKHNSIHSYACGEAVQLCMPVEKHSTAIPVEIEAMPVEKHNT